MKSPNSPVLASVTGDAAIGTADTVTVTITDDDGAPTPAVTAGFATTAVTVGEGSTEVALTVELGGPAPEGGVTLTYRTVAGTTAAGATAGEDYTAAGEGSAAAGEVTIDAGESQEQVTIPILDDDAAEVPETFTVELVAPDGVTLRSGRETATVTITDDDLPTAGSTVVATTPVIADGTATSTVTVTLIDDDDRPFATGGAMLTLDTGSTTTTGSTVTDVGDGTYRATITNTQAETLTVRARVDGELLEDDTATVEFAPVLTFAGTRDHLTFTVGTAITDVNLPVATGGATTGTIGHALTPDLPEGLDFDADALVISGTPTEARTRTRHTLTATEDGGTEQVASLTFDITVEAAAAPALTARLLPRLMSSTRMPGRSRRPSCNWMVGPRVLINADWYKSSRSLSSAGGLAYRPSRMADPGQCIEDGGNCNARTSSNEDRRKHSKPGSRARDHQLPSRHIVANSQ